MVFALTLLALSKSAFGADCPDPLAAVVQAEDQIQFAQLDLARASLEEALEWMECSQPASPALLARLWIAEGAERSLERDSLAARDAFRAANRAVPGYWSERFGEQLRASRDQALGAKVGEASLEFDGQPSGLEVWLDGRIATFPAWVEAGLHLVQLAAPGSAVVQSQLVLLAPDEVRVLQPTETALAAVPALVAPPTVPSPPAATPKPSAQIDLDAARRSASRQWDHIFNIAKTDPARAKPKVEAFLDRWGPIDEMNEEKGGVEEVEEARDVLARINTELEDIADRIRREGPKQKQARAHGTDASGPKPGVRVGLAGGVALASSGSEPLNIGGEAAGLTAAGFLGLGGGASLDLTLPLGRHWGLRGRGGFLLARASAPEASEESPAFAPESGQLTAILASLELVRRFGHLDLGLGPAFALTRTRSWAVLASGDDVAATEGQGTVFGGALAANLPLLKKGIFGLGPFAQLTVLAGGAAPDVSAIVGLSTTFGK